MFWNGSTASDGLSGSGSGVFTGEPPPSRTRKTCTGRAMFLTCCSPSVVECDIELVADMVVHRPRHADAAGLGQGFEPRRDVDPVAVDVVVVDDDVAEIDADAELQPPLRLDVGVALGHPALHLDSKAHRVDDAGELDQHAVAGGLDDAAAVLGDLGVAQFGPDPLERGERPLLVGPISRE